MADLPPDWQKWPPGAKAEALWRVKARDKQMPPAGDWDVWLILAGRGYGKTKTGSEWTLSNTRRMPGTRWAVVTPTFGDARDTCFEGETGILSCAPEVDQRKWNRSLNELPMPNGAKITGFGAESPERLRGKQHHGAWIDELGSFPLDNEAWTQLRLGLRLGEHPQIVITTTPKPTELIKELAWLAMAQEAERDGVTLPESRQRPPDGRLRHAEGLRVVMTTGHTLENAANLAPSAVTSLLATYDGTRIGRQELAAEILEDVPGALWSSEMLDSSRIAESERDKIIKRCSRIVVAVDPAVTSGEDADETGILVCGVTGGERPHGYVLHDGSGRFSPETWARRVVALSATWHADRVVAEVNNGGDLVERVLRTVDHSVPYRSVHASRGKRVRAEPVAALYEQNRVHHCGQFPELEEQMTKWVPDAPGSPDRLDALVWAMTELMIVKRPAFLGAA